jgi:hypothetical protein
MNINNQRELTNKNKKAETHEKHSTTRREKGERTGKRERSRTNIQPPKTAFNELARRGECSREDRKERENKKQKIEAAKNVGIMPIIEA